MELFNTTYQAVNGIPRFVILNSDYTQNFDFQWNLFQKTQLDSEGNNLTLSKTRFFITTQWDRENLSNKKILEAGSGAGRFTEIVLKFTDAILYSFDYSNAVEANARNNGHFGERLKLFQASIYELPFAPGQFDKVFCLGVLQHTPDFKKSIEALVNMVKPGGELVVDFYPIKGWYTKIHAKYFFRPFAKRLSHEKLLSLIKNNILWLINAYRFLHNSGLGFLTRFLPICDIYGTLPYRSLSKETLKEWCILDTFDMFSPEYDHPQKISTVKKWIELTGLEVSFADFIHFDNLSTAVIRATKPV